MQKFKILAALSLLLSAGTALAESYQVDLQLTGAGPGRTSNIYLDVSSTTGRFYTAYGRITLLTPTSVAVASLAVGACESNGTTVLCSFPVTQPLAIANNTTTATPGIVEISLNILTSKGTATAYINSTVNRYEISSVSIK
ncbi:MAG: hypothetical protein LBF16_14595 [Pseudomonadales bacterium]|jgi:hypothetical protein|nr:hypothetical protein [Pseudomonadales bacterium]